MPLRTPRDRISIDDLRKDLCRVLNEQGIDPDALGLSSSHPYSCTCELCWQWWKRMGLGEEPNPPFFQAQLDAETYEVGMTLAHPCLEGRRLQHLWVRHPTRRVQRCAHCGREVPV